MLGLNDHRIDVGVRESQLLHHVTQQQVNVIAPS
jgi:hypothetical protein